MPFAQEVRPRERIVGAQGWVLDQWGRRIQRGVDAQHRRQLFMIDANQCGGRFRGIFGFGGDRGHRLTEELRLTHREHWSIFVHWTVPRHGLRQVGRGHDAPHAFDTPRVGCIDADDPCTGAVQVHELHVQHVLEAEVRHVLLRSRHAVDAADPSHRTADPGGLHQRSDRAADATASMMRL